MGNQSESGNITQHTTKLLSGFGNSIIKFGGGSRPLLSLPGNFWSGGFQRTRFVQSSTAEILVPAADPIMSDYGRELIQLRFTAEYINFVNRQFSIYGFDYNEKFAYAIQMYRIVYNLALILRKVRKAL